MHNQSPALNVECLIFTRRKPSQSGKESDNELDHFQPSFTLFVEAKQVSTILKSSHDLELLRCDPYVRSSVS